jgi:hypothetical protein
MTSKVTPNSKPSEPRQDRKRPWQTPVLQEANYVITGGGQFSAPDGAVSRHA